MFDTKSDTEVLLKYLNYNGIENLNQIHGMWSFAYFSKKINFIYQEISLEKNHYFIH